MGKNAPRDVLAARYAGDRMVDILGTAKKVVMERRLWLAALMTQKMLGADIPQDAIDAYRAVLNEVNLESIARRESKLRHDVKARIEEFNALASAKLGRKVELVHRGFTSRDLTDNVEQMQIVESLALAQERTVTVLGRFAGRAREYTTLDLCARTHNVPAQTTTLGKRFANFGEEMLVAYRGLEALIKRYPIRGIKGPVGTQQDMVALLGSPDKARDFEEHLAIEMDWPQTLGSVGQVYPRSLDFDVVSTLVQLAAAPCNFALMVRLMAGGGLMHEGFGKDQTGSSGMPHKMNSRTCERVTALMKVLRGFLTMTSELAGDQWLEGDVSCSVVRRVALQGAFCALDGLFESVLTVLDEMEVFPGMIETELKRYLPYLSSTALLVAAVRAGMGREEAHAIIKKHATAALRDGRDVRR